METQTFGERLRRLRTGAGLSQGDLAGRSGIPKSRLSRYENDHLLPSLTTLTRLADALEVSESMLLPDGGLAHEAFIEVLVRRGVPFSTVEAAQLMGERVADSILEKEETG
jgi:transcriptional regulator with XRE-family HTH domain